MFQKIAAFSKRFHVVSFLLGIVFATTAIGFTEEASALDLVGLAKAASNLANIKKNLDSDVKSLRTDATTLYSDKDNLMQIKEQLIKLSTETRAQIDSISKLVGEVEGHIKTTQGDIQKTSQHVSEIDQVRKALEGR